MNFTREPIVETIIMPKEGFKLLLRNSKVDGREEYLVDAVEVISFGHSFFFRSLEKPKSVLLPVADYEVEEVREHRTPLKSGAPPEKIKIGGGAPPHHRPRQEEAVDEDTQPPGISAGEPGSQPHHQGGQPPSKRSRRRHRRRQRDHQHPPQHHQPHQQAQQPRTESEGGPSGGGEQTSFPNLIPPPSTLISDTMSRYKEMVGDDQPPREEE